MLRGRILIRMIRQHAHLKESPGLGRGTAGPAHGRPRLDRPGGRIASNRHVWDGSCGGLEPRKAMRGTSKPVVISVRSNEAIGSEMGFLGDEMGTLEGINLQHHRAQRRRADIPVP